eukprot:TRINITY_DN1724_c1_g1_i1.p1 TRINITY_DN1724_c1_g1~~TRINITY_DN1724_c1_g1_i1.p1  ORF type:complete len:534 (-),score=102.59 TRINITY_DN1724_c1_g1_i1:268-1869(-)
MGCCKSRSKADPSDKPKETDVSLTRILSLTPESYPLMFIGALCSFINGTSYPIFTYAFGFLFNSFIDPKSNITLLLDNVRNTALILAGTGVGSFIFGYIGTMIWVLVGERVLRRIRTLYFNNLIQQEMGFFDSNQSGMLVSRLAGDALLVQSGISEKTSLFFYYGGQVIGSLVVSFISGWKMTLVMLALSPLLAIGAALEARVLTAGARRGQKTYSKAHDVASEAVSAIRTVLSFTAEERVKTRYSDLLADVYKIGRRKAHVTGVALGFAGLFNFSVMAVGLYYGGRLVADGEMKPGDVLSVFFAVLIAALGLGQTSQLTPDFAKSRGAASAVFDLIDRKPQMHLEGTSEFRSDKFKGKIKFQKVSFSYPTRPDITVMQNFSLSIKQGQHVAFVGPSGSGKSTVTQLLQRFYEPSNGSITIDGVDIRDYELQSLRRGIGVVNQEPTLFVGTIAENIKYANPNATDDQVIAAAKMANAHDFIMDLGYKYDTQVGERGAQLSGGQKQRIAIARAILKDPRILILDEATSALDAES